MSVGALPTRGTRHEQFEVLIKTIIGAAARPHAEDF